MRLYSRPFHTNLLANSVLSFVYLSSSSSSSPPPLLLSLFLLFFIGNKLVNRSIDRIYCGNEKSIDCGGAAIKLKANHIILLLDFLPWHGNFATGFLFLLINALCALFKNDNLLKNYQDDFCLYRNIMLPVL